MTKPQTIVAILYPTKVERDAERHQKKPLTSADLEKLYKSLFRNDKPTIPRPAAVARIFPESRPEHPDPQYNSNGDFLWKTHRGDVYPLVDMATPHLFYSLRMLYNHSVPPVFRVVGAGEKMNRYRDVFQWDAEYITTALCELLAELGRRDDLDVSLEDQLADIRANCRYALGI